MTAHSVPHAHRIDADPEARSCTIHYVQRELGRTDYGDRRLCSYLQGLVDQHGFPAPLPCARKGQPGLTRAVCMNSRWIRAAVDAWLGDYTPPDLGAAIDRKTREAAAHEMDDAARNLRIVGGRG